MGEDSRLFHQEPCDDVSCPRPSAQLPVCPGAEYQVVHAKYDENKQK